MLSSLALPPRGTTTNVFAWAKPVLATKVLATNVLATNVLAALVTAALVFAAVPAVAAPDGETTWTTFLYQGPGPRYSVIDEVPQATHVQLLGCANGWCEVAFGGRRGYLRADVVAQGDPSQPGPGVLAQPAAAALTPTPKGPCFDANQTSGNGGNAMTVFCQTK